MMLLYSSHSSNPSPWLGGFPQELSTVMYASSIGNTSSGSPKLNRPKKLLVDFSELNPEPTSLKSIV